MLSARALRRAIAKIELTTAAGPWLRAVDEADLAKAPPGHPRGSPPQPLWGGGAKRTGGRFTPKGSFETLYLASDLLTVGREIDAVFRDGRPAHVVRDPFTVLQVGGQLTNVLDLTDGDRRAVLGTTTDELTAPWRLKRSPRTHALAVAAYESGRVLAIRTPSAANPKHGTITAVFVDLLPRFPPSFLEVSDSSGRLWQRLP
jgi:RES domain-containing protein